MHHKARVIAAMALATHSSRGEPSSGKQARGDVLPPYRAEVSVSRPCPPRGRAALSLVAIVGLNAAMLIGFVASTSLGSGRETSLTARAAAPEPASCGCVS